MLNHTTSHRTTGVLRIRYRNKLLTPTVHVCACMCMCMFVLSDSSDSIRQDRFAIRMCFTCVCVCACACACASACACVHMCVHTHVDVGVNGVLFVLCAYRVVGLCFDSTLTVQTRGRSMPLWWRRPIIWCERTVVPMTVLTLQHTQRSTRPHSLTR